MPGVGTKAVIRVIAYVDEFCEMFHVFTNASCRENVMGEVIYVFPLPAVGVKESLNATPHDFDRVHLNPSTLINENDRMVDSVVCVAVGSQIPVGRPAVTDDCSDGFHPGTNSHQGVNGSARNGHDEGISGLQLDTAKHPLSFHSVSSSVLAPIELAFVDSTILLRPHIFSKQPRTYTNMDSPHY